MSVQTRRLIGIYTLLLAGNIGAWLWAYTLFRGSTVLMGTATLAYVLGLRHAVDADHIAAIDNVTRKLVQQGKDPIAVGLYFSLGHSTVVALACGAIAATTANLYLRFSAVRAIGGLVGTGLSASILFLLALANIVTLVSVWRAFRTRSGGDADTPGGLLSRILRPLVAVVAAPWQMYPLGFLFGLGFDTASEVSLLGVSASAATHAASVWTVMVFPALFTAGMALIDTTDGLLMKSAYGWALINPQRKLAYNFAVTLISVLVALIVGGLEALDLIATRFAIPGAFWRGVRDLNDHFGAIGCAVTAALLGCWILSSLLSRPKPHVTARLDDPA